MLIPPLSPANPAQQVQSPHEIHLILYTPVVYCYVLLPIVAINTRIWQENPGLTLRGCIFYRLTGAYRASFIAVSCGSRLKINLRNFAQTP